ncbi:putative dynein light polypeptide 4, axonemal [Toxoplasma gondii TgCatPRC2]|uniref:Dynein light polypeptide 4, axonemal n=15 Tax=Toxoplasma gondii TaxID=5811 RepID=A0A125YZF5_TOXGV|nr:dynein light polypeptide 4, axonemal, putative [Toxoplasma gondii ME49]EPR59842.1 putative dynein light polypeptide 4, axonemal [Toxoplasma gondii GT1]ESS33893.1 putative dynein light polypeptide 4, axonemal [Toxoplasma gondii VEG]KAF4644556.1 putative dynein light polypeptide 4, axonemal [Toxoplasma gondii]KFG30963.1 putative dynein light polypeptide 4, axonemal [Toxoplasma gondii p89]KFG41506.1 putative dynein light polypeptide 4, axonemal [Toxoplasma gondii FOU]KFG42250.1 putative dynei|eukprot:XP_008889244.1 dynein light polypeptide 4, axonemal, putative [Hammondia hammondi]
MGEKGLSKDLKQVMQRPFVKHSMMNTDMQAEVVDIIIGAIDKHTDSKGPNVELATKLIKDTLDRQYGAPWHCVIGEGFSFDVTAQVG